MIDCDNDINNNNDRALHRSWLWEAEGVTRDQDARMMWRAETRNTIDARILELRSACGGCHICRVP